MTIYVSLTAHSRLIVRKFTRSAIQIAESLSFLRLCIYHSLRIFFVTIILVTVATKDVSHTYHDNCRISFRWHLGSLDRAYFAKFFTRFTNGFWHSGAFGHLCLVWHRFLGWFKPAWIFWIWWRHHHSFVTFLAYRDFILSTAQLNVGIRPLAAISLLQINTLGKDVPIRLWLLV